MLGLKSARGRMVAVIVLFVLLLAGISVVAVWRTQDLQQRHRTLERTSATTTALQAAQTQFWWKQAALSALVFSSDPGTVADYNNAVAAVDQHLSQARAEAVAAGKADHVATLDDLTERIGQFNEGVDLALPALLEANSETAVQLATAAMPEMVPEADAITAELEALVREGQEELASQRAAADQAADATLWLIMGFGSVVLLVAVGTAGMLLLSVVRPLASLRATARAITSGELESRAGMSGPEEVSSLARAFNEMTDALSAKTQECVDATNLTGDMIVRLDKDGRFTFLNDGACQTFGRSRETLLGTDARAFLPPKDLEAAIKTVEKIIENKGSVKGVVGRLITPRGTKVVEWNGCPFFDEEGQYAGIQITGRDITERRQMEKALSATMEEYIATTNLTGDIIAKVDAEGRWVFLNDAACQFYGKQREELLGADSTAFIHPEDLERTVRAVRESAATREPIRGSVNRQVTPMGARVVEWNACPLFDGEGQYIGIQMTGRDITERQKAEEALRESEERYRDLFENANDLIQSVGPDGSLVYANRAWQQALGYAEDEIPGLSLFDIIHPDSKAHCMEIFQRVIAGENVDHIEAMFVTKNGKTIWVEGSASCRFEDGKPVATRGIFRDISERKKAEEVVRESEERLRTLVTNAPVILFAIDRKGIFTLSEGKALDALGLQPGEVVGRSVLDVYGDTPQIAEYLQRALAGEEFTETIEVAGVAFETHYTPVRDHDGEISGGIGVAMDITERQKAEEVVRESEERFRDIAENAVEWIWEVDANGRYTYSSPIVEEVLGYKAEDVLGKHFYDFFHPEEREELKKAAFEAFAQKEVIREFINRNVHKNGKIVWLSTSGVPILDAQGNLLGYRGADTDITERKRAEEALAAKTKEYIDTTNLTADIIAKLDRRGNWVFLNDAACRFYGKPREELLGTDSRAFVHPEDLEATAEAIRETRTKKELVTGFVNRQVVPMGTRVVEWDGSPLFDEKGKYAGIQITGHDITERKRMEEALRESEGRFRSLSTSAPIGIFLTDSQGNCTYANPRLLAIAGLTLEESLGYGWTKVIHPDEREVVLKDIAKATREGGDFSREFRILTREGETRWIYVHTSPMHSPGGNQAGKVGTIEDITERKRAEEALRENEARYRLLGENASDIIWTTDLNFRYTYISPSVTRMRGYSVEEVMSGTLKDSMTPASLEIALKTLAEELALEKTEHKDLHRSRTLELELNCKDGTTIWTEVQVSFLRDPDGKAIGLMGVTRDITERKRMEQALRQSEARYRLLAENTSDLIWTMDLGLRYTYMSPAITQMRGYTVEEIMKLTAAESMTPDSLEVARKTLAEELAMERMENKDTTRTRKLELEMYCKDGSTIWTEMHMKFLRDDDGNPIGILGTTRDINDRKRVEEERERLNAELELRAITDSLTGLYDHAHFYQRLAEEIDRSRRYKHGFALLLMDIDDFKRFNESRGHKVGDEMLRLAAHCIPAGLRRSDLAFRYGGDEFAAILPHADPSKARAAVDRINGRIIKRLKQMDGDPTMRLTLTAGVACFPDDGATADELVRIADATLYNAKWVAKARDIMGQREDIQSLVSALVSRQGGAEGSADEAVFRPEALHEQQARIVSSVASSIAVALKDAGVDQALEDPDMQVLATVGAAAEIKDRYIRGHPERMSEWGVALAEEMGLSPGRVRDIRIAALLHDIGKVTVSEGILNKPGKLTRREFASIKDHPIVGATLVSQVRGFERLAKIVRHHHERFDGTGYPDGLAGEDIPPESRILSVLDVFDALTHQRSYRSALSSEEALAEIERGTGTQFDPMVVKAFLALVKKRGDGLRAPAKATSKGRPLATARAAGRGKR